MTTTPDHAAPRRRQPPRRTRALAAPVVALALLTAVACGAPLPTSQEQPVRSYADLAARPRLEDIVARYEQMQQRIRDQLDTELGPFAWHQVIEPSPAGCGFDFPHEFGGSTLQLAAWGFDGPILDADWARARDITATITAEYGFTTTGLQIDEPGRHVIGGIDLELGAN